jgi:hypothetical protein
MKAKRATAETRKNNIPLPIPAELLAGQPGVSDALVKWQATRRVPPVLLLTGPRGCGKRAIAYHIAETLQCERSGFFAAPEGDGLFGNGALFSESPKNSRPGPCGECGACLRALSGQSLDFTEVRVESDEKSLGVDRFREIIEKQGFSSFGGGARIYLITDAERMTLAAANSVLKLLEEPPEGWVFLLTVSDPSLLPSTVVSRCQMLRLPPLGEATVEAILRREGQPTERIATVAKLAEGSLTRARELANDAAWEARGNILEFIGKPAAAYHLLIDYAAADPERFRLLLDQFELLLADLIRGARIPGIAYRNVDARRALEDHAKRCAVRKGGAERALGFWIERSERLFRIRREMTAPLNTKVLIQDFLSPWMDAV